MMGLGNMMPFSRGTLWGVTKNQSTADALSDILIQVTQASGQTFLQCWRSIIHVEWHGFTPSGTVGNISP
jgi:hypothetical protein